MTRRVSARPDDDASDLARHDATPRVFSDFYQAEYRQLVGLGYVLCGSRSVAEDLVQDTFAEAHRRWSVVSTYDNAEAWLRRVLVNKATSRGRRLVSETKMITKLRSRRSEPVTLSEPTSEIWSAVRQLPKRQAQAVALRYWDDLSVAQIAEVLDCSEETVKTHLKRGRAKLADTLKHERDHWDEEAP